MPRHRLASGRWRRCASTGRRSTCRWQRRLPAPSRAPKPSSSSHARTRRRTRAARGWRRCGTPPPTPTPPTPASSPTASPSSAPLSPVGGRGRVCGASIRVWVEDDVHGLGASVTLAHSLALLNGCGDMGARNAVRCNTRRVCTSTGHVPRAVRTQYSSVAGVTPPVEVSPASIAHHFQRPTSSGAWGWLHSVI